MSRSTPAEGGRLDLTWLDPPGRRRLAAALVAHRMRIGRHAAGMVPQHCAFVDAVIAACDADANRATMPAWPTTDDDRRSLVLDGTIDTLEKAAAAHADWAQTDDGGAIALRRLRDALVDATGWKPQPQPRRFGEPLGVLR
jgi:hypothetical protein